MAPKSFVGVRLSDDVLERVDAVVERIRLEQAGLEVNRGGVTRMLVIKGLEAIEQQKPARKR